MRRGIFLAIVILLAGCSDKAPKQGFEMPPVPVQTAGIEVRDVPLFFEALGIVKSSKTAEIKPQVGGMIQEVHFVEGQWVDQGTLLYSIDDAPYAIRVKELQAQQSQNLAYLNNAKKKLARYKSLSKQDLIAQVEWDELETQIALHEGQLLGDEARLAAANLDLQHCKIVAPIAGLVGKSALSAGNMVAAGVPLVTLAQNDPLSVDFSITEKELKQITTKNPLIQVYSAGSDESIASGKVSFMDHTIDSKTGMLAASGILEEMDQPLRPGQSVRVHLYFGKKERAKLVPMRSVKTNQNGPYIFIVKEDNTVEMRSVKLGPEEKGQIIVEEGLDGADKVVTEGQLRLFPGSKIQDVR